MRTEPRVVVLGGGASALAAACNISQRAPGSVVLLERAEQIGGLAGSVTEGGIRLQFGSHRIHPSINPELLQTIRTLLGADLLVRPRHGAIYIQGRWIDYPLRLLSAASRLSPSFIFDAGFDFVRAKLASSPDGLNAASFEDIMLRRFGRTFYQAVYQPAARKVWGTPPTELSGLLAGMRVQAGSLAAVLLRALRPGVSRCFLYPRRGFEQICNALVARIGCLDSEVLTEAEVEQIVLKQGTIKEVSYRHKGRLFRISPEYLISSIPPDAFRHLCGQTELYPSLGESTWRMRGLLLLYLFLGRPQFGEFDTYYFPEESFWFTRISEQKHFSPDSVPGNQTVLCCEIPCDVNDPRWKSNEQNLADLVIDQAHSAGLKIRPDLKHVMLVRLKNAYPVYLRGHERWRSSYLQWMSGIDNLLVVGRQGLLLQNSIHHALEMGFAAAAHINSGARSGVAWSHQIQRFFEFTVID